MGNQTTFMKENLSYLVLGVLAVGYAIIDIFFLPDVDDCNAPQKQDILSRESAEARHGLKWGISWMVVKHSSRDRLDAISHVYHAIVEPFPQIAKRIGNIRSHFKEIQHKLDGPVFVF